MTTKLTILVPDELHYKARTVAALRKETLSEIVRQALQNYVDQETDEVEDTAFARQMLARLAAGEPTLSHDEVWREIAEAEARGELPD
jgi:predicted transcriptional regulator